MNWFAKVAVFTDPDPFNQNQMITEALHILEEQETWKRVRNPTRTSTLVSSFKDGAITVSASELFAGKDVDGKVTSSYVNPK
jgi:hypothetical protein